MPASPGLGFRPKKLSPFSLEIGDFVGSFCAGGFERLRRRVSSPTPHVETPLTRAKYSDVNELGPGFPCRFYHTRGIAVSCFRIVATAFKYSYLGVYRWA